jgi:hypothetical protein
LGQYDTINTGNTFGATYYTDGRLVAPMLPEVPEVVLCQGCAGAFWLSQAEEVGAYERYGFGAERPDPAWAAAGWLAEPDEGGYFKWLDRLLASSPQRKRELRLFAWWRGNDHHREERPGEESDRTDHVAAREANMRALLPLLSSGEPTDVLMQAEILRELGEFDQALAVLSAPLPDRFDIAVQRLRSLSAARDRRLREL